MKKRLTAITLLALILCSGFTLTVFAETTPVDAIPTDDVIATEAPDYTEAPVDTYPVTDPYTPSEPDYSVPEDTTSPLYTEPASTETTASAETTAPVSTAPATNPPEPTEPDEDSTYSDYVSPDPVYTPADQDFEENEWQSIKLDLEADPVAGKQSFANIQNNNKKGNDSIVGFLIVGLVLIFLSIAGFTFVILYRPYKKKAAVSTAARHAEPRQTQPRQSRNRTTRDERRTYNPDDYNDGF